MWLVGGRKGFNSILALIFTFATVIMMYIPLMYIGVSPFIAATISVVIITVITFTLIADWQMKSIGAMLGTISNTLILAYVGGSLGLVMIIYAYSYQMHQILNMYSMAIEIMRGISGTMGIILTVPITSLIMSVLLTGRGKEC